MSNEKLLEIYKNYKSLLSATASDIVAFTQWDDEFSRKEIIRVYHLLLSEFKNTDFTLFSKEQLKELDFKWFDENLICMPTWALDCLPIGAEVWSINDKKIIIQEKDKLSKDTRFGVSAYGFKKSQLRESKLNSILK
jgi:hypothetical protein